MRQVLKGMLQDTLLIAFFFAVFVTVAEAKALLLAKKEPALAAELQVFLDGMADRGCPHNKDYAAQLIGLRGVASDDLEQDVIGLCTVDFLHNRFISIDSSLKGMYKKTVVAHEALHCLWGISWHDEEDATSIMYFALGSFENEEQIYKSALKAAGCPQK